MGSTKPSNTSKDMESVYNLSPRQKLRKASCKNDITAALVRVRGYIEKGWCQHVEALNHAGQQCDAEDPEAQCWCLTGAMYKSSLDELHQGLFQLYISDYMIQALGSRDLTKWNDAPCRTQSEVLDLIDIAIEKSENYESTLQLN